MKKIFNIIIISIMVIVAINCNNFSSMARSISYNDVDITLAKVVEVISGEAIKVIEENSNSDKSTKLIKMIGIDTDSSMKATEYTYNQLLGKRVMLLPDSNNDTFDKIDRYEYKYVYLAANKSISEELLELGLAKTDTSFEKAEQYDDLVKAQNMAITENKGVWDNYKGKKALVGVNINTATSEELMDILDDTTSEMAYSIVNYRKHNEFNDIKEIKFVNSDFTKEWFDKNRNKMSVVSNIKIASFEELRSLFGNTKIGKELANNIIDYRLFNTLDSINDIRKVPNMYNKFNDIEEYISLYTLTDYEDKDDVKVINLNTASARQIRRTCTISSKRSYDIVKERDKQGYIFKSLGELEKKDLLTRGEILYYSDNLSLFTNLNTAKENELLSLFGCIDISDSSKEKLVDKIIDNKPYVSKKDLDKKNIIPSKYYDMVETYIYASQSELPEYININITDRYKAAELFDIDGKEADKYIKSRKKYKFSKYIKFDYEKYASDFTLYTNINTASKYELENIYGRVYKDNKYQYLRLPADIIDDIIDFREDQPFNSLDEVSEIFSNNKKMSFYNNIKDFIVFY
ncbi:hypothetical protein SH1V18_12240 [Vallitalea longa]|uniref:TNase-like domain-containing protein n=1 Tax=Vallitalea longa TaxID=2936439 RepID=A0A9W6DFI5_9FIRM|nr:helix-hairpin-helix domain-containing protein [Vallitalea longa]GKX28744.1 hypothetical protein SH1V18_12240 [Vallitalea longa]